MKTKQNLDILKNIVNIEIDLNRGLVPLAYQIFSHDREWDLETIFIEDLTRFIKGINKIKESLTKIEEIIEGINNIKESLTKIEENMIEEINGGVQNDN
jgi:hypothetical protein